MSSNASVQVKVAPASLVLQRSDPFPLTPANAPVPREIVIVLSYVASVSLVNWNFWL